MSASSASFEKCLEVTDYKKFDTGNALPKSIEPFLHFFKILKLKHFSDSPQIHGFDLELILEDKSIRNSCQQM